MDDDPPARRGESGRHVAGPAQSRNVESIDERGIRTGIELIDVEDRHASSFDRRCKEPGHGRISSRHECRAGMRAERRNDVGDLLTGGGAVVGVEMLNLRRFRRIERREINRRDVKPRRPQLTLQRRIQTGGDYGALK